MCVCATALTASRALHCTAPEYDSNSAELMRGCSERMRELKSPSTVCWNPSWRPPLPRLSFSAALRFVPTGGEGGARW